MAEELMGDLAGCSANLHQLDVDECETIRERSLMVRELYKQSPTFEDLGKHLYALMLMSPTPLGNFVRSYCTAAQPPISLTQKRGSSGDLLPMSFPFPFPFSDWSPFRVGNERHCCPAIRSRIF